MRFLKNEYVEAGRFLKQRLVKIILIVAICFIAFCLFGYWALTNTPEVTRTLAQTLMEMMEQKGIMDEQGAGLAVGLFANNFIALGLTALLGFVPFIFFPAFVMLSNSAVLSVSFAMYGVFTEVPVWQVVVFGILPHGIFELTAFFIAGAMGIYLCKTLCVMIVRPQSGIRFGSEILSLLRVFILIVIPLLIIAAVVEAFVTPSLLAMVVG